MTDAAKKPTPPGTWPLLTSIALTLVVVPAALLGQVVPQWLAIVGAVVFLGVAIAALIWSYRVYQEHRGTPARGVPIAGVAIGVIPMLAAALVLVPAAMA